MTSTTDAAVMSRIGSRIGKSAADSEGNSDSGRSMIVRASASETLPVPRTGMGVRWSSQRAATQPASTGITPATIPIQIESPTSMPRFSAVKIGPGCGIVRAWVTVPPAQIDST